MPTAPSVSPFARLLHAVSVPRRGIRRRHTGRLGCKSRSSSGLSFPSHVDTEFDASRLARLRPRPAPLTRWPRVGRGPSDRGPTPAWPRSRGGAGAPERPPRPGSDQNWRRAPAADAVRPDGPAVRVESPSTGLTPLGLRAGVRPSSGGQAVPELLRLSRRCRRCCCSTAAAPPPDGAGPHTAAEVPGRVRREPCVRPAPGRRRRCPAPAPRFRPRVPALSPSRPPVSLLLSAAGKRAGPAGSVRVAGAVVRAWPAPAAR